MTVSLDKPRTAPVLTADDITALRTASNVSFHLAVGMGSNYFSGIQASVTDWQDTPVWTAKQQRLFTEVSGPRDRYRRILIDSNGACGYASNGGGFTAGAGSLCFTMIHSSQYSDTWQTIVALLRTGDEIRLKWVSDGGSNDITRQAGLHVDEVFLMIQRANGQRLHFLLEHTASLDNTARMCRLVQHRG